MTEQQAQTHSSKQNVDAGEIAKFNALAEQWWDPNSQFRPLHDINPLRLNYIDERVSLPGKKVIDIGCGGGLWQCHGDDGNAQGEGRLVYLQRGFDDIVQCPDPLVAGFWRQ